ncbi:THBS2S [Mytilus edulis]|uniref:THBS2S n=1 Tax=Mytilus edulis TaxID=6550 RepID=A0A8S3QLL3_MYTED|nr:THBS2S [Mytilus edulis]
MKHFFNTSSSKCEPFWYGGCKGNQNNFQSDEECQAACVQEGAIDLHKMRKDVIDLNTKDKLMSNITLISSNQEKTDQDVTDLQAHVDGQWSSWIDTPSSVTWCWLPFAVSRMFKSIPSTRREKCTGSRNKHVKCQQYDLCPVNGAWSVWSDNTCSVTCGVGTRSRSRSCSNPYPQYGGNKCIGIRTDHVTCTQPNKCPGDYICSGIYNDRTYTESARLVVRQSKYLALISLMQEIISALVSTMTERAQSQFIGLTESARLVVRQRKNLTSISLMWEIISALGSTIIGHIIQNQPGL